MTTHHQALAQQVVEQFRQSLDETARAHITDAHFEDLEQAIQSLLAHEHEHVADLLEALAHSLRSGADRPQMEL
jgi:hypothetical protein